MWIVGIAMAALFVIIYYNTRLYASMVIYIYFFLASVYGWAKWIKNRKKENTTTDIILHAPQKAAIPIIFGIVLTFLLIYFLLIKYSDNQGGITIGDSLTTTLNIVALWMAARRWAEQWLLLIPANAISSILLIIQGDHISGILFAVYFIVSILGYFNWKKLAKQSIINKK